MVVNVSLLEGCWRKWLTYMKKVQKVLCIIVEAQQIYNIKSSDRTWHNSWSHGVSPSLPRRKLRVESDKTSWITNQRLAFFHPPDSIPSNPKSPFANSTKRTIDRAIWNATAASRRSTLRSHPSPSNIYLKQYHLLDVDR